jgi:transposase
VLDPYKSLIQLTLKDHPKLLATRLYDMITPRGYTGSVVQLRRYVRTIRPAGQREAFFRLRTLPGEQAQVDWGCFGSIVVGKSKRPLSCFVMVLGWSRAVFAYFTLDQTLESFVRCHVRAFDALGGVPRALLYDNLKTAVLERQGDLIRFHPRLLELAGHYHFATKPCAPYRGNEKGKVERAIRYLRYSFFDARSFRSVDDLNTQLATWIETVAHTRLVPGDPDRRLVAEALTEERPRLLPLPQHPFESDLVRPAASGKTPYIRFDLNDYSIPHDLVGKPLTLIASEQSVRIADGDRVVAQHRRSYVLMSIIWPSAIGAETPDGPEVLRAAGGPDVGATELHQGAARGGACRRGHDGRGRGREEARGSTELRESMGQGRRGSARDAPCAAVGAEAEDEGEWLEGRP